MITCAHKDCDVEFEPKTHNNKYHDYECQRLATNERLKAQYHDRQRQKRGEARFCTRCSSKLSRYNSGNLCGSCETTILSANQASFTSMISNIQMEHA